MGWRNITFTCLDDATKAIDEARAVLKKHGTGEDLLLALLAAQSAINHAITEAVSDGIPRLCIPIGEEDELPKLKVLTCCEIVDEEVGGRSCGRPATRYNEGSRVLFCDEHGGENPRLPYKQ